MKPIKPKKCAICKNKFKPFQTTQRTCSIKCSLVHGRNRMLAKQDKAYKELKVKFKANDIRNQHKLTQAAFNKLRKLQEIKWFTDRGLEPECISCGKTKMDWCCGHLKTVGSSGSHRYSEDNTKLQCNRYCNMGLSGNINGNKTTRGYLQGLIDRFGRVEAKRITDSLADEVKKWQCDELIQMRKEFNAEIRKLYNVSGI